MTNVPIPLAHIRHLGVHFAFKEENLLPDSVMCDVVTSSRSTRPQGQIMIIAKQVQITSFFITMMQHGLADISCNGQWIQRASSPFDSYKVHFIFVPKDERDEFVAMKHDSSKCQHAFFELSKKSWDIVVWNNGDGNFHVSCTRPQKKQAENIMFFNEEALRCS